MRRHLAQPGPALPPRLESHLGHAVPLAFTLEPGLSLEEALLRPLAAAGFASAMVELEGGGFAPFAYVLPAPAPDATHAAWYSETHAPAGAVRLERATVTVGLREGRPSPHCHAVWVEEGAGRRAGHVLPDRSIVAAPIAARAWGLVGLAFEAGEDAETNFTLFRPAPRPGSPPPGAPRAIALRIRPNEDAVEALEATCRAHGFAAVVLRGGLGSLVGPRFMDGRVVEDHATELLVTGGGVTPEMGGALSVVLTDMQGRVHEGRLLPGGNAVCITFELLIEEQPAGALRARSGPGSP